MNKIENKHGVLSSRKWEKDEMEEVIKKNLNKFLNDFLNSPAFKDYVASITREVISEK